MKLLILCLFLFSTTAFAEETKCEKLRYEASSACTANEVECRTLGACIAKRNTCPTSVKSEKSCLSFNECMSDVDALKEARPKDVSRIYFKKPCIYHWTESRSCRLYNTGLEFITFPTCPGRRISGKNNDDVNFDCEGHRKKAKIDNKNCIEQNKIYASECSGEEDYKDIYQDTTCGYLDKKLFPADTKHNGSKTVNDQERDKYKQLPPTDEGTGGNGSGGAGTGK